jgi:hypothetical protein
MPKNGIIVVPERALRVTVAGRVSEPIAACLNLPRYEKIEVALYP